MILIAMGSVALVAIADRLRHRGSLVAMAAFAFGLAGFGAIAGYVDTSRHQGVMLQHRIGPVSVQGIVLDRADRTGTVRAVLGDLTIEGLAPADTPDRVRITLRSPADPVPGSRISVSAVLNDPAGPAMPGAFDFRRYAYFEGLGAVGFAVGQPEVIAAPDLKSSAPGLSTTVLESIRFRIGNSIARRLPDQSGAVAIALLTGERGRISEETTEALRVAGLAHLLAISGLHVGLVAGLIFFVVRAGLALIPSIALRWPIKKLTAGFALAGCLSYVVLVGAPVPTQRAFVMAFVVLVAVMLDRTAISLRTVSLAALAVLILAPHSMLGPSFQLSFAAVTVLVALFEWLTDGDRHRETGRTLLDRGLRYSGGVLLTTFVVGLATLPFSLFHFSRLAPWSMAANLIGVPLTAFVIMPLGVLSMAAMPLGLEGPVLAAMGWGIDGVIGVSTTIAAWPAADLRLPAMPVYGLSLAVAGGLWLCLTRGTWRLAGVPLVLASLVTPYLADPPAILVADDLSLIAFVDSNERSLALSKTRSERFVRGIWLDRLGFADYELWPQSSKEASGTQCDAAGCSQSIFGRTVLIASNPRGLAEDCRTEDLLIVGRSGLGDCHRGLAIDEAMVKTRGALAIYPSGENDWRIVGTRDGNTIRPWILKPE